MVAKTKISGATIAYQLRPHKAVERNLFLTLLKKLDRANKIDLQKYRYVGFGAAFLEDFKALHSEFCINKMDCIEYDPFAYTRQEFNNPFDFIKLYNGSSTDYINSTNFKQDSNQIIWWDFASPKQLRQSLNDVELTAQKVTHLDILKFTFNAEINSFVSSHYRECKKMATGRVNNYKEILKFFDADNTLKKYLPESITAENIKNDFSAVIRSLALRAVRRGLSKSNSHLDFFHCCSFDYADGQLMTTVAGVVCKKEEFQGIIAESGLKNWEFYRPDTTTSELIPAFFIKVPAMTVSERTEIDKKIHTLDSKDLAKALVFKYGMDLEEHAELIDGYCKFYRYLPYYSKVIF